MRIIPPLKPKNSGRGSREPLTPSEIKKLISAARQAGRHGQRDAAMILLALRTAYVFQS